MKWIRRIYQYPILDVKNNQLNVSGEKTSNIPEILTYKSPYINGLYSMDDLCTHLQISRQRLKQILKLDPKINILSYSSSSSFNK